MIRHCRVKGCERSLRHPGSTHCEMHAKRRQRRTPLHAPPAPEPYKSRREALKSFARRFAGARTWKEQERALWAVENFIRRRERDSISRALAFLIGDP